MDIDWEIYASGGVLGLINSSTNGTLASIPAGDEITFQSSGFILGFGKIDIVISCGTATRVLEAFVLGPLILLLE
jgi:hypothetical protein